jgi:two-component system chemotaxis response regulator CheB
MGQPSIVTIGASAGGIEALTRVVRGLRPDIPAAILVVVHISEQSVLPAVLARQSRNPTAHARDGEVPKAGHIYVAPPGYHLLLEGEHLRLRSGPRENGARPAIDPLFRSAARSARDRVIGVILSGLLDDGVAGLYAIKARGGTAIVQDPDDAAAASMPRNALRYVDTDYCVTADQVGPLLFDITTGGTMTATGKRTSKISRARPTAGRKKTAATGPASVARNKGRQRSHIGDHHRAHAPASPEEDALRCPDCGGPLYRVNTGQLVQWACREGHVFSPDSLNGAQTEALERALWLAVRTMKERALVDRTMSERAGDAAQATGHRLVERAQATERDVELLQSILARI